MALHTQSFKLFILICLVGMIVTGAQIHKSRDGGLSEKIREGLKRQQSEYIQEKVWLHLDKPFYSPGDDMWLSAYLLLAGDHLASPISRILYIDLIGPDRQIVRQLKLRAEHGRAHSVMPLPDSLAAGIYHLRAYTNWMRNFDETWMYHREIHLMDDSLPLEADSENSGKESYHIDFFPEGGNLVHRIPARLAFKATDSAGNGVEVSGYIFDGQGDEITRFSSEHLGMGTLNMLPFVSKKYKARVTLNGRHTKVIPLPEIKPKGAAMTVNVKNEYFQLIVRCTPELNENPFVLAGHVRGQLFFLGEGTFAQEGKAIRVPIELIPGGIAHFTLFEASGTALAERLVFVEPKNKLEIQLTPGSQAYNKREKITLDITSVLSGGQPTPASLSMTVVDQFQIPVDEYGDFGIEAYLLLNSDLPGKIEHPGYYFNTENADRKEALDLLMLTQGWRRFSWKEVLGTHSPEKPWLIERDLYITGEIKNIVGKSIKSQQLLLTLLDESGDVFMTESDKEGRFVFSGLTYYDTTEVRIIPNQKRKSLVSADIFLDETKLMEVSPQIYAQPVRFSTADFASKYLENQALLDRLNPSTKEVELEAVTITGTKRNEVVAVHNKATYTVEAEQLTQGIPLLESLQGRVPGLQVFLDGSGNYTALIRGVSNLTGSNTPLVVWDGMIVDFEAIRYLFTHDVEKVEILSGADAAIYGGRGGNGVIAVTSKKGADDREKEGPQRNFIVQGYTQVREFYVPPYDDPDYKRNTPDVRSTLYWNPDIRTDSMGKGQVSFFASDQNSSYQILVEGISIDGRPGNGRASFKIR